MVQLSIGGTRELWHRTNSVAVTIGEITGGRALSGETHSEA